jgi:uroporphyrinogen decarboxylase
MGLLTPQRCLLLAVVVALALALGSQAFTTSSTSTTHTRSFGLSGGVHVNSKRTSRLFAASSQQEDLEMTRQIIFQHLQNKEGGADVDGTGASEEAPAATTTSAAATATTAASRKMDRPANDLMIRAALGEVTEKTPVWLFRQAGRHLPEYTAYKLSSGRNFLQMLEDPLSVAECTMQPVRRYPLDAAILFSDILVVAQALGMEVTMPGGVGILVPEPLTGPEQVNSRIVQPFQSGTALSGTTDVEKTAAFVQGRLSHVIQAVREIRTQMKTEKVSIPLIGFSAAPWTLMFYMVGGSSKKNNEIGVEWLSKYPAESKQLLNLLTDIVIEYLAAQVEAGCHMLQVFEAMGMMIDAENLEEHALPCLEKICKTLKQRYPDVPLMVFSRGACYANEKLAAMGYDVVTLDGDVDRKTARQVVNSDVNKVSLQGNYDPKELIENADANDGSTKTVETVRQTARQMLQELGPQRLIANLGEGLGGKESTVLVQAFVDAIHEESAAMIQEAAAAEQA